MPLRDENRFSGGSLETVGPGSHLQSILHVAMHLDIMALTKTMMLMHVRAIKHKVIIYVKLNQTCDRNN